MWQVSKRVWDHAKGITQNDKVVLLALADKADEHGICWPRFDTSYETLADMAGIERRSVIRIVNRLCEEGHICKSDAVGRGHSNTFIVLSGLSATEINALKEKVALKGDNGVTNSPDNQAQKVTDVSPNEKEKVTTEALKGDNGVTNNGLKGDTGVTQPIKDSPSIKTTTSDAAAAKLTEIYLLTTNGKASQSGADLLDDILKTYPPEHVIYACSEAIRQSTPSDDKRNLSYVEAVCKRKASGQPDKPTRNNGHRPPGQPANKSSPPELHSSLKDNPVFLQLYAEEQARNDKP